MLVVDIGKYRGNYYANSVNNITMLIPAHALPDGSIVTIRREHSNLPLVKLNEDNAVYWYPLDLLRNLSKSDYILRRLK